MPPISFTTEGQQGIIPQGSLIELVGNYIVLVGENNSGKSSLLQLLFKRCGRGDFPYNLEQVCFILPDRMYVDITTETRGRTLINYNNELSNSIGGNNRSYQNPGTNPISSELPKLLLSHTDFLDQAGKLRDYFRYFGLPSFEIRGAQEVIFKNIQVVFQGSGLRSIFAILAALTDDNIKLLLIDEPEISLEPRLQKLLRELFYQNSSKQIIVATHSQLFLNRRDITSNYVVSRENDVFGLARVSSEEELYEITFDKLGCSLEDLFFPNNFLIVEGSTDQIIVEKVMQLKDIDKSRIKVVSASGVSKVANILSSVYTSLVPLVLKDSPYKSRVVVIVDRPYELSDPAYEKIGKALVDPTQQLFKLTATTLEDYLHEDLYAKSGLDKTDTIKEIRKETDYEKKFQLKTKNARTIAVSLTEDDLKYIPEIVEAVEKAYTISLPRPLTTAQSSI